MQAVVKEGRRHHRRQVVAAAAGLYGINSINSISVVNIGGVYTLYISVCELALVHVNYERTHGAMYAYVH